MTRFLTLLAVAAIAGAMYVAAAPGGLRSSGPSAKQFKALSKKVTKLQKQVTTLKKEAEGGIGLLAVCTMHAPVGVDQVGTSADGYLFGPPESTTNPVTATATSALNLASEASPQHKLLALNTSQQACVEVANATSTPAAAKAVAKATLAAGH